MKGPSNKPICGVVTVMPDRKIQSSDSEWWRGAAIYQIYPRSFRDTTGNGVGDLNGITQKLDYVASLGVDALWISPFFQSPMKDFGYDVSDYQAIDPLFGTMADFDALRKKAHSLGLKIILDLILSHTSDQHPWFIESRESRNNPRADWYVWADPKPDGTPPNNWMSIFGGSAWQFDTKREQYYLHNFIKEQPDLNYHNPDVQDAMLAQCRFWLDRGIDGLRLDVINFCTHDKQLRDNPPKDPFTEGFSHQYEKLEPYNMQRHIYDKSRPENINFIKRIRALCDEYDDILTLGEIGDDDFLGCAADYTAGDDRLHTAYNFALIFGQEASAHHIKTTLQEFGKRAPESWPSWTFCNHDNIRVVSRWARSKEEAHHPDFAKVLIAALGALRGNIHLYQGEELGLSEAVIPFDQIQDPWGKNTWPDWQGRDGCRTPMPWDQNAPQAGFSDTAETWLPIPEYHHSKAVSAQEEDEHSPLAFTRRFLTWRKTQGDLISGDIAFEETGHDKLLVFRRGAILCAFNLGDAELSWKAPGLSDTLFKEHAHYNGTTISLRGYASFFGLLSD